MANIASRSSTKLIMPLRPVMYAVTMRGLVPLARPG